MMFLAALLSASQSSGGGTGGIPKPVFSPTPGSFENRPTGLPVTISTTRSGATMKYTVDASIPSVSHGTLINAISGSVTMPTNTVTELKAVTIFGGVASSITSGTYDVVAGGG